MLKYYIPVEDGDGHVYLCEDKDDTNVLSLLLSLEENELEESSLAFINSFTKLDGLEYYIVLKDDLDNDDN